MQLPAKEKKRKMARIRERGGEEGSKESPRFSASVCPGLALFVDSGALWDLHAHDAWETLPLMQVPPTTNQWGPKPPRETPNPEPRIQSCIQFKNPEPRRETPDAARDSFADPWRACAPSIHWADLFRPRHEHPTCARGRTQWEMAFFN